MVSPSKQDSKPNKLHKRKNNYSSDGCAIVTYTTLEKWLCYLVEQSREVVLVMCLADMAAYPA
eukprot:5496138-Ditylum_brightwellii.AAC.1